MKKIFFLIFIFVAYCYLVGYAKDANAVLYATFVKESHSVKVNAAGNYATTITVNTCTGYVTKGTTLAPGSYGWTLVYHIAYYDSVTGLFDHNTNPASTNSYNSNLPIIEYTNICSDCPLGSIRDPVTRICSAPVVCTLNEIKQGTYSAPGKWPDALCLDGCKFVGGAGLTMYAVSSNETWFTDPLGTGVACVESLGTLAASPIPWPDGKVAAPGTLPPLVQSPDGSVLPDQDKDGVPSGPSPASGGDANNDGDAKPNLTDTDINGNGLANGLDPDVDGDGVSNGGQTDRYDYPFASPAASGGKGADADVDGDGLPNIEDMDIDGDGIPNAKDYDLDGDGYANTTDQDVDGDGILNQEDDDPNGNGGGDGSGEEGEEVAKDEDGDEVADEEQPAVECPDGWEIAGGKCYDPSGKGSASSMSDRFTTMKNNISESPLLGMLSGSSTIPSGESTQSVSVGESFGGSQSINWSDYSVLWTSLRAVLLILASWTCVKIVLLGK